MPVWREFEMCRTGRLEVDLDPVERLVAERDCERLMVDYARRLDLGQPERVAELFTDDGVWEMPGRLRFEGKDQLRAAFSTRMVASGRTARHVVTNVAIDVVAPGEATGFCYLINYRHDSPTGNPEDPAPAEAPMYVGQYHDRFVRTAEGWRFKYRRSEIAFARR
jgi:ketosteroid isomerase-like protein